MNPVELSMLNPVQFTIDDAVLLYSTLLTGSYEWQHHASFSISAAVLPLTSNNAQPDSPLRICMHTD